MLTMTNQTGSKLQRLLASWPNGAVLTTAGLKGRGYSHVLLNQYRTSGWLVSAGRGALTRAGDQIDWRGGLYALQEQLKLPIHLGGKSALDHQGSAHYLKLGTGSVTLFAGPGTRLPAWFLQHEWGVTVTLYTTNLFSDDVGLTSENAGGFSIAISSRERAMFEMLYLVPQSETLEEAKLLMGGLTNLRPHIVQHLLESCSSVKVKRLFMLFAEELKLPWVKRLNLDLIDFGTGARTLVKGGKLHPKYHITLPANLFSGADQ